MQEVIDGGYMGRYCPSQRSLERVLMQEILKDKLWQVVRNTLFRFSWRFAGFRVLLLRMFGATVAQSGVSISPSVRIDWPWNVAIEKTSSIGRGTWVYALDSISIGERTCIGEDVRLLTGYHDISSLVFALRVKPIRIGSCAWIATGATILPGVSVGDGAVVAAGSVVTKDVEAWTVVGGNPARFLKRRELKG